MLCPISPSSIFAAVSLSLNINGRSKRPDAGTYPVSYTHLVPDKAVLDMMVRAGNLKAVAEVSEKTDRAFRGAAYAIGAEVEITDVPGYLPVIERLPDKVMTEAAGLLGDSVKWTSITPGLENMTSTDVGDLTHLMPVLNFTFGGFEGALHSKDFRLTDAEKAFVLPAKLMALIAYRLPVSYTHLI